MKATYSMAVLFALALLAASCVQSDDDFTPGGGDVPQIVTQGGDWRVTYFYDKDKEETHHFNGYTFRFKSDGTLTAMKSGAVTANGKWSVSTGSNKFILDLGQVDPLGEMTDDWLILEKSDNRIRLRDDNSEHREELYLER